MRKAINAYRQRDPRITYRGTEPSRIDALTDAVFGIAITLLVFNVTNPNSFTDLMTFTKTLPAFLVSIGFVVVIWNEHVRFSEVYGMDHPGLMVLNTLFVALIIFYVYPLRFLTLFLTNFYFQTDIRLTLQGDQVPQLMVYYGLIAAALYFTIFLFYHRVHRLRDAIGLSAFEVFYTAKHRTRLVIMFGVPLLSVIITVVLHRASFIWASVAGGVTYLLYTPAMILWSRGYRRGAAAYDPEGQVEPATEPVSARP